MIKRLLLLLAALVFMASGCTENRTCLQSHTEHVHQDAYDSLAYYGNSMMGTGQYVPVHHKAVDYDKTVCDIYQVKN